MMRFLYVAIFLLCSTIIFAQQKTENLVIVTLDDVRWQEVCGAVGSGLMRNKKFTRDSFKMSAKSGAMSWIFFYPSGSVAYKKYL